MQSSEIPEVQRYTKKPFPAYAHRPGATPHPKKAGGHSESLADPVSEVITIHNWHEHQDYLYGVDLFNNAFYWEAHVWWEAVWKSLPKGDIKDFVQGLIKVAAGSLKESMGESDLAKMHCLRGHELMSKPYEQMEIDCFFGVSRKWWNNIPFEIPTMLELHFDQ